MSMSNSPSTPVVNIKGNSKEEESAKDLRDLAMREPQKLDRRQLRELFSSFYEVEVEVTEGLGKGSHNANIAQAERRAAAYVTLSSLVQSVRAQSTPLVKQNEEWIEEGTKKLVSLFEPVIEPGLQDSLQVEQAGALTLLSALFDVDSPSGARLVQEEVILNGIMELLDEDITSTVLIQTARLVERAMAHPLSRSILREECDFRAVRWLMRIANEDIPFTKSGGVPSDRLQAKTSAALALVKLVQGSQQDEQASKYVPSSSAPPLPSTRHLASLLQKAIIGTPIPKSASSDKFDGISSSFLDAVEGLAYLSTYPAIRTQITSSKPLLTALFALSSVTTRRIKPSSSLSSDRLSQTDAAARLTQTNLAMHYGLALLFANLCTYKPVLSQEEQQIKKLRKLAKPPSSTPSASQKDGDEEEEDEHASNSVVLSRTRTLIAAGLLSALAGLARSPSPSARACAGRAYLGVIQDATSRGEVLKSGGGKALLGIVGGQEKLGEQSLPDWGSIQALAKLSITASPFAVFGPDPGATHDAIRPLTTVLTYSPDASSTQPGANKGPLTLGGNADGTPTQLQRFESLMALTNIASLGPDMAKRIVKTNGLVKEVESLLVEEHVLIRRAAVELVCNLAACEEGFSLFLPESSTGGNRAQSRIHVLVALSDVEDLPTRKAASGALAMLSSEEAVCLGLARLQKERGSVLGILSRLLLDDVEATEEKEPDSIEGVTGRLAEMTVADPELVHRGIAILRNLAVLVVQPREKGWRELVSDLVREGIMTSVDAVVKDYLQRGGSDAKGPVVENALEFGLALQTVSDAGD